MSRSVLCGVASFAMLVGVAMFSSHAPTAEAGHGCGGGLFGGHHRAQVCAGGSARGGFFARHHRRSCGGGLFSHHRRGGSCAGYVSHQSYCPPKCQPACPPKPKCCPQPKQDCCPTTTHYSGHHSGHHSGYYNAPQYSGGISAGSGCVGCEPGAVGQGSYEAHYGGQEVYGGQPQYHSGGQQHQQVDEI